MVGVGCESYETHCQTLTLSTEHLWQLPTLTAVPARSLPVSGLRSCTNANLNGIPTLLVLLPSLLFSSTVSITSTRRITDFIQRRL